MTDSTGLTPPEKAQIRQHALDLVVNVFKPKGGTPAVYIGVASDFADFIIGDVASDEDTES